MKVLHKNLFVKLIKEHLIDYPTPINISYWWGLGSAAGIFLVVQIFTGVFLAMHYTAHVELAFFSVEHIMRDVNFGWLVRYLHANGASFFFVVIYLHISRGVYAGSYMKPRGFLWCVGVIIFILMMASAFLGYVLVWGQMSLWAATVITNLFSAVPVIGGSIVEWLWGGFSVDNATLNRFFSLHYLLPFLIAAFVLVHLAALHFHGSNNPLGISGQIDKISFYPHLWVKDIFGWVLFGLLLSCFVYFAPNYLGHTDNYIEANSMVTPSHIVPEWYFLPHYAILRSIPHKLGGVVAMFGAILVLLLMPYINTSELRSSLFRPVYKKLFWLLILDWVVLGWIGGNIPETPFVEIGQLATFFYFFIILAIMPALGFFERYVQSYIFISDNKIIFAKEKFFFRASLFSAIKNHSLIGKVAGSVFSFSNLSVRINGVMLVIKNGHSAIQACEFLNVNVPRFCYHEFLSIAGNCRMCLVEIINAPKLQAACAIPLTNDMLILTESPVVLKARESVMEFLLANHPLDCPICDQGGECDLQDQSLAYGNDFGRFNEYKRATSDKQFGILIKSVMTRCIHCTRCVRFASEIGLLSDLGTVGRGSDLEIDRSPFDRATDLLSAGPFLNETGLLGSELSGNLIDVCPVGALTSLSFAFRARSWELKTMESLNLSDAMGSSIRVDLRGVGPDSIMRVLPRLGTKWSSSGYFLSLFIFDTVNEQNETPPFFLDPPWISDTTRFSYDGLKQQRLLIPMIVLKNLGQEVMTPVSWFNAFSYAKLFLLKTTTVLIGVFSNESDLESLLLLKNILNKFNSEFLFVDTVCSFFKSKCLKNLSFNSEGFFNRNNFQLNYLDVHCATFVPRLTLALEQSDVCLLIGVNPRVEATALNLRLRQRFLLSRSFELGVIGSLSYSLGYTFKHLGTSIKALLHLIEGRSGFSFLLLKARFPLILIGSACLVRADSKALWILLDEMVELFALNDKNLGFLHSNVLHTGSGHVGSYSLGLSLVKGNLFNLGSCFSFDKTKKLTLYILGSCPSINFKFFISKFNWFLIYQGYHGDECANLASVVFPAACFVEKTGCFISAEGRIQLLDMVSMGVGQIRQDWHILKAFGLILFGERGSANSIFGIRNDLKTYGCSFIGAPFGLFLAYEPKNSFGSCVTSERLVIKDRLLPLFKNNFKKRFGFSKKKTFFSGVFLIPLYFNSFFFRLFSVTTPTKLKFLTKTINCNLSSRITFLTHSPFYSLTDSFFLINSASLNSSTMVKCNKLREVNSSNFCLPVF